MSDKDDCVCGLEEGTNDDCERCRFVKQVEQLTDERDQLRVGMQMQSEAMSKLKADRDRLRDAAKEVVGNLAWLRKRLLRGDEINTVHFISEQEGMIRDALPETGGDDDQL